MFYWARASLSLQFQNLGELILPTEGLRGQSASQNQMHSSFLAFQGQGVRRACSLTPGSAWIDGTASGPPRTSGEFPSGNTEANNQSIRLSARVPDWTRRGRRLEKDWERRAKGKESPDPGVRAPKGAGNINRGQLQTSVSLCCLTCKMGEDVLTWDPCRFQAAMHSNNANRDRCCRPAVPHLELVLCLFLVASASILTLNLGKMFQKGFLDSNTSKHLLPRQWGATGGMPHC